ncbi:MAG: multicopper oxidase domain-containing protein [Candidatus Bathyarchaeia archaeon]
MGRSTALYAAVAVAAIIVVVVGFFAATQLAPTQPPSASPTVAATVNIYAAQIINITLYGGVKLGGGWGFGNVPSRITIPGPTLTFKVGDTVNVTLINLDANTPHNFAVVDSRYATRQVLFNSTMNVVPGGGTGWVVFTVTQAGSYFYECRIPGHMQEGMSGTFVVNP